MPFCVRLSNEPSEGLEQVLLSKRRWYSSFLENQLEFLEGVSWLKQEKHVVFVPLTKIVLHLHYWGCKTYFEIGRFQKTFGQYEIVRSQNC